MINHINQHRRVNIITIEDPIEFLHRDAMSNISQREVGSDTLSFAHGAAPRAAAGSRRHPDRRDPRPARRWTPRSRRPTPGHLVFSTLHTTDATQTINRILSFYPPHQHQRDPHAARRPRSGAICSLRLVPRSRRRGRVPACRGADQHGGGRRQHPRHREGAQYSRSDRRGLGVLRDADLRPVADAVVQGRARSATRARSSTPPIRASSRSARPASIRRRPTIRFSRSRPSRGL